MTKVLAIIPARGGSKRIPQKNIKAFLGKPIISYSILTAIESNIFDEIMVSTDDNALAEIAVEYGGSVPFMRSEKNANDHAHIADVISEVLDCYKGIGKEFDYFCVIFATAPFITAERLKQGFELMVKKGFDSVFPVLKYSYPIQRALKIEGEKLSMINPENYEKRSQDLPSSFHDSGQFYWMSVKEFNLQKTLFSKNAGAIILSEMEVQDIDTPEDWEIAELKFKLTH
ncbi:MAG: pseudaminic acid cytidylyltransferase [Bacteroidetes bacterium]|nr:pseudaminic acid cytidylyltransferase [Bacteroidota bacterium]